MGYARKVVLDCQSGWEPRLDRIVEDFIRDGVQFVAVVGPDCDKVEEIIDELVVANGDRNYDLLTSSHPGESVEDAVEFARSLTHPYAGEVQVVRL